MIYWISVCWKDPPNKWSFNGNKCQPQRIRKYKHQRRPLNKNHFGYSWHSARQSSPPEARALKRGSQRVPPCKKKSGTMDLSPLNAEGCKKDFCSDQCRLWVIQNHRQDSDEGIHFRRGLVPPCCLPHHTPAQPRLQLPLLSCALLLTNGLGVEHHHCTGHPHSTGATQRCFTDEQDSLDGAYCKTDWCAHPCSPGAAISVVLLCYRRWMCYVCYLCYLHTGHRSHGWYHRAMVTRSREHPGHSQPTSVSSTHLSLHGQKPVLFAWVYSQYIPGCSSALPSTNATKANAVKTNGSRNYF